MSVILSDHLHKPVKALDGLELHYVGDIAIILMDCGQNRINTSFLKRFNELMDDVESNLSCKGLITTGKGKFYGNGLDLEWLGGHRTVAELKEFGLLFHHWLLRILLFPLPTLAALNGHAFAGAALMAFAHDLRVQYKDKGWLSFNEVWISRQFPPYHYSFLRTKLGRAYSDAIVLGKRYTASEALKDGLVHATSSAPLLLSESIQLLKSFYGKSGYPRESMHLMKADVFSDAVALQRQVVGELEKNETEDQKETESPVKAKL